MSRGKAGIRRPVVEDNDHAHGDEDWVKENMQQQHGLQPTALAKLHAARVPQTNVTLWTPDLERQEKEAAEKAERLAKILEIYPGVKKDFGKDFDRVLEALDHVAPYSMKNPMVAATMLGDAANFYLTKGQGTREKMQWFHSTLAMAARVERGG